MIWVARCLDFWGSIGFRPKASACHPDQGVREVAGKRPWLTVLHVLTKDCGKCVRLEEMIEVIDAGSVPDAASADSARPISTSRWCTVLARSGVCGRSAKTSPSETELR